MKQRIYIAYTGGTIGMKLSKEGYAPEAGYLSDTIANMPDFYHDDMPKFEIRKYQPLIDSANVSPEGWQTDIQTR